MDITSVAMKIMLVSAAVAGRFTGKVGRSHLALACVLVTTVSVPCRLSLYAGAMSAAGLSLKAWLFRAYCTPVSFLKGPNLRSGILQASQLYRPSRTEIM